MSSFLDIYVDRYNELFRDVIEFNIIKLLEIRLIKEQCKKIL